MLQGGAPKSVFIDCDRLSNLGQPPGQVMQSSLEEAQVLADMQHSSECLGGAQIAGSSVAYGDLSQGSHDGTCGLWR